MGGLARRASFINAFKYVSNGEVPTISVDAGNLFTDERFAGGQLPSDVMTKNRWVVKGYGEFHVDAANISYSDLPYLTELLKKDGYDNRIEEFPFISKLISANVEPLDDSHRAPQPYVIREITLKRGAPGQKVKVGIVGFTEINIDSATNASYRITDPFEAASRVLPELKKKVDVIIALAYMPRDMAQKLAINNSEIDTVIAGKQINSLDEPEHYNRATVTTAFSQTKHLGEMLYYVKSDGAIENQVNRFNAMDSVIPDDPDAVRIVTAAHDEFTEQQNQAAQAHTPTPVRVEGPLNTNSLYVGADACASCHTQQYQIWQNTNHAHAMATLEKKNQQFDTECVKCHVVGFNQGGFQSLVTTPQFANVQCEACHGPGKQHVENPGKGYGQMTTPSGCVQCHTQSNSPDFEFESYWQKIKH